MKDEVFLVLNARGVQRITKRAPGLSRSEIAVKLSITVPASAFRGPVLSTTLDIPEDRVIQPDISLEVVDPTELLRRMVDGGS